MTAQAERSSATRDLIVNAAASEFVRNGYGGTSHSNILKVLGKSTPNYITYHFPAKSDIARAVLLRQEQLLSECVTTLKKRGISGLEALVATVFIVVTDEDNMNIFRAAMSLEGDRSVPDRGEFQPCTTWMSLVTQQLQRAKRTGEIAADIEVDDAAWMMISALYGTYQLADRLGVPQELPHRVGQAWVQLLDGVGYPDSQALIRTAREHAGSYFEARTAGQRR